jgi:arylformamidase
MRIYDVSLTISPDLPTWPGDPRITIERVQKIENGGHANISHMSTSVHAGTHVDAPYHFLPQGETIEHMSLNDLTGRVYVARIPDKVSLITAAVLEKIQIPPRTRRILFKTRNSEYWANQTNGFQTDFVAISPDGAEYLVKRGLKLVGIDYLSIAPYKEGVPTHQTLLKASVILVEGLNLSQVPPGRYTLYCLPLKLAGCDGAPARVILIGV